MFDLNKYKILNLKDEKNVKFDLYAAKTENDFNISKYIFEKYHCAPSMLCLEDTFNENILYFLLERSELIKFNIDAELSSCLNDVKNFKKGTFWFKYKNVYLRLNTTRTDDSGSGLLNEYFDEFDYVTPHRSDSDSKPKTKSYSLWIVAPSTVQKYPIEDFKDYIVKTDDCRIHLFIKNEYNEYNFEPLKVAIPDINIELNYGKHFTKVDQMIQERLTNKNKGLFMFHGNPGTGKTTYIKYLANKIKKDFIFIPTTMIDSFTSDPNCLQYMLKKPNSVLILEDAEKAIVKRYGDNMDSSQVSSLLNLTDGILSDMLKISVILTYNCPKNEIDSALKRKGRLQADYEFSLLSIEDAKNLAQSLNVSNDLIEKIDKPMSLADVFNLGKDVEFKNELIKEEKERVVGFGN